MVGVGSDGGQWWTMMCDGGESWVMVGKGGGGNGGNLAKTGHGGKWWEWWLDSLPSPLDSRSLSVFIQPHAIPKRRKDRTFARRFGGLGVWGFRV